MNSKVKFSIITVCYNAEQTLEKTIVSVLRQDYLNYEYLIIDGGSNDNTKRWYDQYYTFFNGRCFWYSEPDKGLYDAMNKGVKYSEGQYLIFLNADDELYPNALTAFEAAISQEIMMPDIIYGDAMIVYPNNTNNISKIRKANPNITLHSLMFGMGIIHQSMATSIQLFSSIGNFNLLYNIGADWDFLIRAVKSEARLLYIEKTICSYTADGLSSGVFNKQRHLIRKSNRLYKYFDYGYLYDLLNLPTMIQLVVGKTMYNKLRYLINKLKYAKSHVNIN